MFERFHEDARQAVAHARGEAERAGLTEIGCGQLLLGLLAGPGPAAAALNAAGAEPGRLRDRLPRGRAAPPDPLDAEALASLGIDLDAVRRATDGAFGPGALDRVSAARRGRVRLTGTMKLTTDAKKALELALRTAAGLRQSRLSAGHLLIGIIDQGDNQALAALDACGIDIASVRADVLERLRAAA